MGATRREFFAYSGAAALGSALAGGLGVGLAPGGALAASEAPKKVKIRVGARTGCLGKGGPEALAVAKKLAIDGIEIEAGGPNDQLECADPELQKRYVAEIEKTGVAMASICMGLLNSNPVFSDPRAKSWLDQTIDATAALGAKSILVAFFGSGNMKGKKDAQTKTIEIAKSVAEHAEKKGVILGLENTLSAEENIEIVDKIGSPFVRVYYDIGNSQGAGYDVPKEIRTLGTKYICEIHFKDGGALLGRGKIDMAAVGLAVRDIGYEGWIVLETGNPLGPEASSAYNTGFIRGLLCS
jgi:sugar phosphate isomerase/epimerase